MEKQEIAKLLTYLSIAYPNQKPWKDDSGIKEIISVWHGILYIFPAHVVKKAADNYIKRGEKFFPSLSLMTALSDDVWRQVIDEQRGNDRQAEKDAAKLLFHAPLDSFAKGYPRLAVSLIRRVTAGDIKFGSDEWKREYKAIFPDYNPMTGARIG